MFFRPFGRVDTVCGLPPCSENNYICHEVCFKAGLLTDKKKSPTGRERGSGFQESEKQ